jgi:hypothetical protein
VTAQAPSACAGDAPYIGVNTVWNEPHTMKTVRKQLPADSLHYFLKQSAAIRNTR